MKQKHRFRSYEDKWMMIMDIVDRRQNEKRTLHELVVDLNAAGPLSESMVDELANELFDLFDAGILTESMVIEMFERKQELATEAMLDELAAIGALATSIDKNTGETLYRYDNTNPRAQAIMAAIGRQEMARVLQ